MTSSFSAVSSQLPDDPKLQAILAQFAAAECCWFSSVRPDGRVHMAPIWHIWHAGQIFVVTQSKSVRARNIVHNPSVSAALPDPLNPVIVEGRHSLPRTPRRRCSRCSWRSTTGTL